MENDQLLTIFGAAHNARALASGNLRALLDHGLCWPLPNAAILGEHMIESGLLALPGYLLSRDPLVAYNTACLLSILIAAAGAYLFAAGSFGRGAWVAAVLFALNPRRLGNLEHLAVAGTHWIPFVLLAALQLLEKARVRDALLLAATAIAAGLTGSYPAMVLAVFGGPFLISCLLSGQVKLDGRRLALLV
ncbi:MAG: hypothetical protein D6815_06430, partial [Candidatus Dadabacteria bacterium]